MDYILIFKNPYMFDGKEYNELDLSGIERLNAMQLKEADKKFVADGNVLVMSEMTLGYACNIAHLSTGLPYEFFDRLPAKEAIALKNIVTSFFYN